ncbi:ArsR family transcriptional regulator [Paenibacillus selenitireducens]|uniref:ArsR family transcriptional regulator n=1 Tax=Paenibacillus selenitireducens TaxID=1324314 RepID=A0A1T2X6T3_9BACL|nr:metalloregulator ArsR/SmtB family transcription factor [Paenibacillus selenitireducens]OPA75303.1 ArsR family transcriptional regulator [Paenibacillus selenitireducens]
MSDPMDLSTRETILHMLKTQGDLSAKDLTEQLGITTMAVRRHISTLEKDNFISSTLIRQPMGRPTSVYRLSEEAEHFFPKKYHAVALDLLGELADESGQASVDRLFDRRKESLAKKYEQRMQSMTFEEKVAVLTEIQNENGYMADLVQQSEDEYILNEFNCPISQIANQYQHACTCELSLFQTLLGADVRRTECLAKGDRKCSYHIRKQIE